MYLRTLTLRGFKSFASATTLHLEPGITCVVGPNGSGKSNVVDALAWVMGEQGAKTLRGGAMADVIFAGTSARAPLGRAEVSLTIDNSDGALPIDYAEVTITRTMFRSGGSEYAINGSPCRLLDVQELLSDSGIGREMHVIVGQGQLDAVLSASPEERRGFIEEAAGVLKHRKRKEKALRKLDAMSANLARLTDLTAEIRRQLGPLAKQADLARRAQVIQADLRDARARLLADDLVRLREVLRRDAVDESALRDRLARLEEERRLARDRLAETERVAAEAAPRLSEITQAWYRLAGLRERLRSTRDLAAERCRLLGAPEAEAVGRDPEDLAAQAGRAREAEAAVGAELDAARAALDRAVRARQGAEERAAGAERDLELVHRTLADRREGLTRLAGQVAARRGRLEAAQSALDRLREDLGAAHARREIAARDFAELEQTVAGEEDGEEGLDAAHEAALARAATVRAALASLEAQERRDEADRTSWAARRDALQLSLRRQDGTGALLEGAGAPGVLGTVAEHLVIEPGLEAAVAAALGVLADAAAVASTDAAIGAVRYAREHDAGAVRVVVATGEAAGPPSAPPVTGRWVAEVVTARDPFGATLSRLLAGAVLVPDLDAAREVVTHSDVTVVTRDGDVLTRTSAVGGGDGAPSVLKLHVAHEEAVSGLSEATARVERARFAISGARARVADAEADVARTLDALHASDARLAGVAERLGQLASTLRAARAEADRVTSAIERAEAAVAEDTVQLADLAERLRRAQEDVRAEDTDDLAVATARRDEAADEARGARQVETDARLALRTIEERVRALAGRAESLDRAAGAERAARDHAAERARRRAAQAKVAAAVLTAAERAVERVESAVAAATAERERAEQERSERDTELGRLRQALEELAGGIARLTDVAHRDEVGRAEQRLRLAQLEDRAIEELGTGADDLVAEYGPEREVPVPPDADGTPRASVPYDREQQEKRLRAAERALSLLGRINPLALEEHAALAERHAFLTRQLTDLRRSRADLLEIVREIDERVEAVFAEAFADTAQAFETVFARVFPGGEGRLVLTDPGDMLATGVEVEARPPGKKVKRLSLLSGGERSLTAIAILVAIFTARPSPFYVMDEVEAALDDVNLGRLLEIFTELRASSQLVVVTHQKRTMEVADALYGVTMRGDGVSAVVSQRLREAGEPAVR